MFNANQARDKLGRFAGGAEAATRSQGRYPVAAHEGNASVASHASTSGDFTIDPRTGKAPVSGFMVGGGGRFIGGWTDKKTGQRYEEHSTRVSNETLARSLGRMRNQIAIFDLNRKREIATGGNGRVSK